MNNWTLLLVHMLTCKVKNAFPPVNTESYFIGSVRKWKWWWSHHRVSKILDDIINRPVSVKKNQNQCYHTVKLYINGKTVRKRKDKLLSVRKSARFMCNSCTLIYIHFVLGGSNNGRCSIEIKWGGRMTEKR